MATKRKEKLEKRARRKNKRLKSVNTPLDIKLTPKGVDLTKFLANPYTSDEDEQADIDLMKIAWKEHYGEFPKGFSAPLFEEDENEEVEERKMLPWVETYKALLIEKYTDLNVVEHKLSFSLFTLIMGFGDAIPPED